VESHDGVGDGVGRGVVRVESHDCVSDGVMWGYWSYTYRQ